MRAIQKYIVVVVVVVNKGNEQGEVSVLVVLVLLAIVVVFLLGDNTMSSSPVTRACFLTCDLIIMMDDRTIL